MNKIQVGDKVLFYHNQRLSYLRKVLEKGNFECHKGRIPWVEISGKAYGDNVVTHLGIEFVLLRPSLADLLLGIRRRTSIAYPKDIGYMLLRASIEPGIKVVEVGSGSGALTSILARYVQPSGHVYSFERRPEFSELARRNIKEMSLEEFVSFEVRDVAEQGFNVDDVDVCVVDVPEPWSIVEAARNSLSGGGRWVSLSPSTEQLQETRRSLEKAGFLRFEIWEVLMRQMYIKPQGSRPKERMISHTAYMFFADLGSSKSIKT